MEPNLYVELPAWLVTSEWKSTVCISEWWHGPIDLVVQCEYSSCPAKWFQSMWNCIAKARTKIAYRSTMQTTNQSILLQRPQGSPFLPLRQFSGFSSSISSESIRFRRNLFYKSAQAKERHTTDAPSPNAVTVFYATSQDQSTFPLTIWILHFLLFRSFCVDHGLRLKTQNKG